MVKMDMHIAVRSLLKRYGLTPSKGLGQNLLVDDSVLEQILASSDLLAEDLVLEVGPGLGLLTRQLALRSRSVVAIELDHKMVSLLSHELADIPNVQIIQGDILTTDVVAAMLAHGYASARQDLHYKVVANLPYYITSAALRHLLAAVPRPDMCVLMVQWEVAERLAAAPGDLSLLGVSVQVFGRVEIIRRVPADSFYPAPQVDSAIVRIVTYPQPLIPTAELELFFRLAKAGFGQKRKQLHNSLAANTRLAHKDVLQALEQAGIVPERRAETLSLEEWATLCTTWPHA
ncbi:MAG: 16S rRNA (adenine(1518)-N(6)/adenine(1519)-N(6))-dimethyltransferase RsmA [Anaerolineae bacterium]